MRHQTRLPLRVLVCSSGNPEAACLAAGLLQGRSGVASEVLIQGVGNALPAPEVGRVLAELGLDLRAWEPQVVEGPPVQPVDVGLTVCVPT